MPTPQLLDVARDRIRAKHYSLRTENAYLQWIRRFTRYHRGRHPRDMGGPEVQAFLTWLATERRVAAPTQNQALAAILFLYRHVLELPLPWLDGVVRARKSEHVPVVLSREEVARVLDLLTGTEWLVCAVLYGSGIRLSECVELRIKDIDLEYRELVVRGGKGGKDRVTVLPARLVEPLRTQSDRVHALYKADRSAGYGGVALPFALARKYPNAATSFAWQYVFPARSLSRSPDSGSWVRTHANQRAFQRAMQQAVARSGINK